MQLGRTDGAQLLSAPAIDLGQQGKSGSSFPMDMGGIWAKKQSSGGVDLSRSPVVLVSGRHAPHRQRLEKVSLEDGWNARGRPGVRVPKASPLSFRSVFPPCLTGPELWLQPQSLEKDKKTTGLVFEYYPRFLFRSQHILKTGSLP